MSSELFTAHVVYQPDNCKHHAVMRGSMIEAFTGKADGGPLANDSALMAQRIALVLNACASIPDHQLTVEDGAPNDLGAMIDHLRSELAKANARAEALQGELNQHVESALSLGSVGMEVARKAKWLEEVISAAHAEASKLSMGSGAFALYQLLNDAQEQLRKGLRT